MRRALLFSLKSSLTLTVAVQSRERRERRECRELRGLKELSEEEPCIDWLDGISK
jgi:hypothetical protein